MIDIGKAPVKSVSRNLREKEPKYQQGNPEKEKRRIARKKERRATLILGNYLFCQTQSQFNSISSLI